MILELQPDGSRVVKMCVVIRVQCAHILWQFQQSQGSKDKLILCHTNDIKLILHASTESTDLSFTPLWFS